jgi:FkbM family methyltransferase
MSDYSQFGEQKFILDFFEGKTGRFLDLGAFDGTTGSNTRCLSDSGWKGVLVEASPANFRILIQNHYANKNLSFVLGALSTESKLTILHDCNSLLTTTLDENHIDQYIKESYYVSSFTPKQLASVFGVDFQFVSLDIEGLDLPVLREIGCLLGNTELLCIEDSIPGTSFDEAYYLQLREAAEQHGFKRVVARTNNQNHPANTILSR